MSPMLGAIITRLLVTSAENVRPLLPPCCCTDGGRPGGSALLAAAFLALPCRATDRLLSTAKRHSMALSKGVALSEGSALRMCCSVVAQVRVSNGGVGCPSISIVTVRSDRSPFVLSYASSESAELRRASSESSV